MKNVDRKFVLYLLNNFQFTHPCVDTNTFTSQHKSSLGTQTQHKKLREFLFYFPAHIRNTSFLLTDNTHILLKVFPRKKKYKEKKKRNIHPDCSSFPCKYFVHKHEV